MPARIAIVSDSVHPFHAGGKETRIHRLSQGLVEAGFDVDIYTMKWWDGADTIELGDIRLVAISRYRPMYAGGRRSIWQAIAFGLACLKLVRYHFDVIEVDHMPFFPLLGARLASWWRRRPLVATWHEVWGLRYWRRYLGYLGVAAYAVERLSVLLPDRIIAVSPLTADRLHATLAYRGPIELIANGIDVAKLGNVSIDDATTAACDLIYAGRLIAHKRVDVILQAYALMRVRRPGLRLRIIGDGPEATALQELAATLGLDAGAIFSGRLAADADVHAAMRRACVFVTASEREGFGIAALEAMACGLPVVMSDHPDNAARLFVAGGGLAVPATPQAFAAAAERLLSGYPTRPADVARAYDWGVAQRDIAELYSGLTSRDGAARHAFR